MDGEAAVHLGGVTFGTFLVDVFVIFMFVLWIWLLISVFSDLFRRHDISGGAKVIWVIFLIILPYLGVLAYVLTQGGGMAELGKAGYIGFLHDQRLDPARLQCNHRGPVRLRSA